MNNWIVIRNCCQGGPRCDDVRHTVTGKPARVVHIMCVSRERATATALNWRAYNAVACEAQWFVRRVVRPNAGAPLFAPVVVENNKYVEHGITPSHDEATMRRAVERLNAGELI